MQKAAFFSGLFTALTLLVVASCGARHPDSPVPGQNTEGRLSQASSSSPASEPSFFNDDPLPVGSSIASNSAALASAAPMISKTSKIPEAGVMVRVALPEVKGAMVYYPPVARGNDPAPISLMLHGMCASGDLECPFFAEGATRSTWLVCPNASFACDGNGFMWGGPPAKQAATQDAALRTLKSLYPDDTADGGVLIGYSLGAQAALAILARQPDHWRALMIVNSSNVPTPEEITRSGIRRIALVAGDNDGTAGKLSISAKRLKSAGFDAQYFSLGKVGHFFDGTTSAKMVAPLTWAME